MVYWSSPVTMDLVLLPVPAPGFRLPRVVHSKFLGQVNCGNCDSFFSFPDTSLPLIPRLCSDVGLHVQDRCHSIVDFVVPFLCDAERYLQMVELLEEMVYCQVLSSFCLQFGVSTSVLMSSIKSGHPLVFL